MIYLHNQGMIHGDLKGVRLKWLKPLPKLTERIFKANILINETGRALLTDFGLLKIISDPTNFSASSSYAKGGLVRWMSPELLEPNRFGLKNSRPTKSSDYYALGMVIYETVSGNVPFHKQRTESLCLLSYIQVVNRRNIFCYKGRQCVKTRGVG